MRIGMKLSARGLLPILASVAGCVASPRLGVVSWEEFVAQHPGVPQRSSDYAPASVKIVDAADASAAIEASRSRFGAWCSAHGGVASATWRPEQSSPAASTLHQALSLKSNDEQAALGKWKPMESFACAGPHPTDVFLGAMVIELEAAEGSSWPVGRYPGRLTYAFFTEGQVDEFGAIVAQQEKERTQRFGVAAREREERRAAATRKLRQDPRVGDRTNVGTIVELRPPLALLQYDERYRLVSNRPASEWVRIDTLSAPSDQ